MVSGLNYESNGRNWSIFMTMKPRFELRGAEMRPPKGLFILHFSQKLQNFEVVKSAIFSKR